MGDRNVMHFARSGHRGSELLYPGCVLLFSAVVIVVGGNWPEIYWFYSDPVMNIARRVLGSPVHLHDDVMISLRAGYIFYETGTPAFNRGDIAQPSTSYIAPLLFAGLVRLLPENNAVLVYAALGALAVCLTFSVVAAAAKSKVIAAVLVASLLATSTNLAYVLQGWDHLFQALFLSLAAAEALKRDEFDWKSSTRLAGFLALGVLFRPDGLIIAGAIAVSLLFSASTKKLGACVAILIFIVFLSTFLGWNYLEFGRLTPTTARLKIGASASLWHSIEYFWRNFVLTYSSGSLFVVLLIYYFRAFRKSESIKLHIIVSGCILSALAAFLNSDVFPFARMYWTPACVLAIIIASAGSKTDVHHERLEQLLRFLFRRKNQLNIKPTSFIVSTFLGVLLYVQVFPLPPVKNLVAGRVLIREAHWSSTAQQFLIAKWIETNLAPADGAIGFYFLGVSYHLPAFEIADFLGKADEAIAQTQVKWGPPGHNKWDTSLTVAKWRPQAIVPPTNSDISVASTAENARDWLASKRDYGFAPDLMLSEDIKEEYIYCYLASVVDLWGFYLRRDIATRHSEGLRCAL